MVTKKTVIGTIWKKVAIVGFRERGGGNAPRILDLSTK